MSTEIEQFLNAAADAIPEPEYERMSLAERSLFGPPAPQARRGEWLRPARRLVVVMLAAASLLLVGVGTGIGLAVVGDEPAEPEAGPGFLPAPGWTSIATGAIPVTEGPTAIATNGPLITEPGPIGTFPRQTVERLTETGILIFVTLGTRNEHQGVDALFPPRELPLRLKDAVVYQRWEGQPRDDVPEYRLPGAVGSWNADARVYFGILAPSEETLADAQEELDRLMLPGS